MKPVSMGLVQQMDLDLVQCEQFAASEPVQGLEVRLLSRKLGFRCHFTSSYFFPEQEGVLLLCFSDLRQLLDLFVSWDWSAYLADYGSPSSKYLRVKPEACVALFDRLREGDRRSAGGVLASVINKKDRDKRRLVDTVHKQLRALCAGGAGSGAGGGGGANHHAESNATGAA